MSRRVLGFYLAVQQSDHQLRATAGTEKRIGLAASSLSPSKPLGAIMRRDDAGHDQSPRKETASIAPTVGRHRIITCIGTVKNGAPASRPSVLAALPQRNRHGLP